jgi:hypothetical protein
MKVKRLPAGFVIPAHGVLLGRTVP